jgi:hypothetical protein
MFNIKLVENAGIAFEEASISLKKILNGEVNFKNFRSYVLNLHSSLELFFKKKLYDENEFMIFNFYNVHACQDMKFNFLVMNSFREFYAAT